MTKEPLLVDELFHACQERDISAASSAKLEPLDDIIGQNRAVSAVNLAVGIDVDGHNIFVLGPPGTGRRTFIQRTLSEAAKSRATPSDWCYVNNFNDTHCPIAIELPAGLAKQFAQQMDKFIAEVESTLSAAFEGDDYRARHRAIEAEFQSLQSEALESVHQEARKRGVRIMQSPSGTIFAPVRDGEALGPDEFEKLPEEEQKRIEKDVGEIGSKLERAMEAMPRRMREMRDRIAELDNQITSFAVCGLIEDLSKQYTTFPSVVEFLNSVEQDLIENSALLRPSPETQNPLVAMMQDNITQRRYAVNVIVDRDASSAPPVITEEHPTYGHLLGRVENRAHMGTLTTDFTLIRGGALHRANGGYLVLDARRVLSEPFAWDALKQALKSRRIKIESIAQAYAMSSTVALEPEPIPLNVKVALVGDRHLYYFLQSLDPEFSDLFKVAADFDDRMDRTAESQNDLARIMAAIINRDSLLPATRGAMCRVVEEAARTAGDREKLSTEVRRTEALLREGNYFAKQNDHEEILASDIDAAIAGRELRHGRVRERLVEEITRGNLLIDTEGAKIGHVNALAVHQLGDYAFGRPNRITARVSLGTGKVIDIERESELGGSLHSKGILILSGFIAANYGIDRPLSLAATIAFEQSYGGVDGDSASSAELYALLSAIAEVPIVQSFAVTGSVNQYGDVQAIGGVNEKIEGFFDICDHRGLTGEQGVLIPVANIKHLMLRKRVIDAVAAEKFRVFAVEHIDAGLSILTGLPIGIRGSDGHYPHGTLNRQIHDALAVMAERRKHFAENAKEGDKS